jgi:hypothetical protein
MIFPFENFDTLNFSHVGLGSRSHIRFARVVSVRVGGYIASTQKVIQFFGIVVFKKKIEKLI